MPVQFGSVLLITMGFCGRVVLCQGSCRCVTDCASALCFKLFCPRIVGLWSCQE
ncbi:hypothetical protein PR001_g4581 [Phytophthora rubi]|uniref:Uncharacterized protein n=1 Tax=Phytophthora rubi TaxID=129364 RepID=A0A6A3NM18_9STRA|nr:hypothetical protein PR001_g4581 [Phytophthora rubi]